MWALGQALKSILRLFVVFFTSILFILICCQGCILVECFGGRLTNDDCQNIEQLVTKVRTAFHLWRAKVSCLPFCDRWSPTSNRQTFQLTFLPEFVPSFSRPVLDVIGMQLSHAELCLSAFQVEDCFEYDPEHRASAKNAGSLRSFVVVASTTVTLHSGILLHHQRLRSILECGGWTSLRTDSGCKRCLDFACQAKQKS